MFKDYLEVRDWLESFIPQVYGKENLGLLRIEELLKRLGNPEKKFKSIHIGGTSGKGSCTFYISQILKESGYKVGLHISPHLSYVGERMQINNKPIEESRLVGLMGEIKPAVEAMRGCQVGLPSYFEILVAVSFLYFAKEKVDFAVVEVGLGGRLDATNVLEPEISVITNIGLDHTEILGNSIEKIAKEKAGIIKQNIPAVTGAGGKALKVIEKAAKSKNAILVKVSTQDAKEFLKSDLFGYITKQNDYLRYYPIETQISTIILPIYTLKQLKINVSKENLKRAFGAKFVGRFEKIGNRVILDGAHNVDKIKVLVKWIKAKGDKKITLVVGFKEGKNWKKMLKVLLKDLPIKNVIATKYFAVADTGKGSAVDPKEVKDYLISNIQLPMSNVKTVDNSNEAVFEAMKVDSESLILVTGSLYLVGEVREMCA